MSGGSSGCRRSSAVVFLRAPTRLVAGRTSAGPGAVADAFAFASADLALALALLLAFGAAADEPEAVSAMASGYAK